MADGKVHWYGERVKAILKDADDKILDQLAFQTLGQARINIRENRQIDTGFMTNSGFVVSAQRNTYLQAMGAALAAADREMAPPPPVNTKKESAVAFGAHYSIFQEMRKSFLYQAMLDTVKQFGGIVQRTKF